MKQKINIEVETKLAMQSVNVDNFERFKFANKLKRITEDRNIEIAKAIKDITVKKRNSFNQSS